MPTCNFHPLGRELTEFGNTEVFITQYIITLVCDDPYIKYYTVHSPAYTAVPMVIRKYTRHVMCLYTKLGNDTVLVRELVQKKLVS